MNANELRLGNWVEANSPMMQVKEITEHTVGLYMPGSEADPFLYDIEDIRHIKLSPEILEKCGFEDMHEKTYGYVEFADKLHAIYSTADGYSFHPFCTNDKDCQIKIKFLHQLQNLIFALTGEELTYKQ